MARIRSTYHEAREVPGLGVVDADELVTVPADAVYGFTCQDGWEPDDQEADEAHAAGGRAEAEAVEAELVDATTPGAPEDHDNGVPTARELVDQAIPVMSAPQVRALLDAESDLPRPRTSVVKAAQARLADLGEDA